MTDINRPLLGEPNAPCRTCGSPLAADQRYCLHCGARRAEARLPFLDILAQQAPSRVHVAAAGGPAAPPPPRSWSGRLSTNAAAVAGVACLLLALGVGVLIGGLGQDDSTANARPQVISVGNVAPAAAPVAAATPSVAAPATTAAPKATIKSKSSKKTASDSKTTNNAVKDLESSSGDDYSKKSEKLPLTTGTGGKPPPVDKSKPVGGGSDVESIG